MPSDPTDAHDLIDLQKVAERLGITPLFLRWSLDAGLPLIFQKRDGQFGVSMGRSDAATEAPAQSAQQSAPMQDAPAAPQDAAPQGATPQAAAADPAAAPAQQGEVDFLRQHLSRRDEVAADKDKLLAELALRIAALGETAIERGFSTITALHATPRLYEPRQADSNQPHPNDRTGQIAGQAGGQPTPPQAQTAAPESAAPRIPLPPHPPRTDPAQDEINRRHELAIENIRDTLILIRNYLAQIDPLAGEKP